MSTDLLAGARLAVIDLETAGLPAPNERILEIGLVEVDRLTVVDSWTTLINPGCPVPARTLDALGLSMDELRAAPKLADVAVGLAARLNQADAIAGHNVHFDLRILQTRLKALGLAPVDRPAIDTLSAARAAWGRGENTLGEVAGRLGVAGDHLHRALGDAQLTAGVLIEFAAILGESQRLDEFPGYVPDASVYPKPAKGLPYQKGPPAEGAEESTRRRAVNAYQSGARNGSEPQHGDVMKVLIRSAVKARREISVITKRPGGPAELRRAVPRGVDDLGVLLADGRGGEQLIPMEQIVEVRW